MILVECENCGKHAGGKTSVAQPQITGLGAQHNCVAVVDGPAGWTGHTRCDECNTAVRTATTKALQSRAKAGEPS